MTNKHFKNIVNIISCHGNANEKYFESLSNLRQNDYDQENV